MICIFGDGRVQFKKEGTRSSRLCWEVTATTISKLQDFKIFCCKPDAIQPSFEYLSEKSFGRCLYRPYNIRAMDNVLKTKGQIEGALLPFRVLAHAAAHLTGNAIQLPAIRSPASSLRTAKIAMHPRVAFRMPTLVYLHGPW